MRVLLIEDDPEIARRLSEGLSSAGFAVERADNGADGYAMGTEEQYDAVVLDLGLPQMSGLEVLRKWRAGSFKMPVLVLTARGSWPEKVDGLNAGADDYITKPFHIPEVVARLNALIRRSAGLASSTLTHKNITLDLSAGKTLLDGQPVELTAKEMRMLNYFMHRIGRVVSQAELTEHLYSLDNSRESNTIEVYVSRLRRKFGADLIKTIRGLGYRMD
ncbi:response regulator transcription factor [Hyphomicrobium sp.]|uniref:response regulator transcription factor n=1 Tax=Hyphomicrobium sp. TaxID=82 RepID=UPI002E309DE1|nr:response regulator transcription factor [Hyphomicrobium sp.]HEX2842677.1 response regulator transcription factor [Hyphomicrobium sp.]